MTGLTYSRNRMTKGAIFNVLDFGAKGDGTTDDTAAINTTIEFARSVGGAVKLPCGNYKVTSTIRLASENLAPVSMFGDDAWYVAPATANIIADINGPVFDCSGTPADYAQAPLLCGFRIRNLNSGTAACGIKAHYTGGLRTRDLAIEVRNIGVNMAETISPRFDETIIAGFSDAEGVPATQCVAGYFGGARNIKIFGGRVYTAKVALDLNADSLCVVGLNAEFCSTFFRHAALLGAVFLGGHIEQTQCIVTNAITIPTDDGATGWADNGSAGIGITGAVQFIGTIFSGVCQRSNLAVIKSQAAFGYHLIFDGCAVPEAQLISGSFTKGAATGLPSGTVVSLRNQDNITSTVIPQDAFSGYSRTGTRGFDADIPRMICTIIDTPKVRGELGDDAYTLERIGFSYRLMGYESASLASNFYNRSVAMEQHFIPSSDNLIQLGTSSRRFKEVFAGTGTVNTSDGTMKTVRGELSDAELRVARTIATAVKAYQWNDAIGAKGADHARLHTGWIAQEVAAAFVAEGLDPARYAMWCKDEPQPDPLRPDEPVTGETRYGLRMDQVLAFVAAAQEQRLAALEAAV